MSGQIKTPTNQKLLTNVAVVRMKKCGKRYEVACYKNKVLNWRNKMEKDIDEGQLAKRDDLQAAFGTEDQLEICKMGDLQVSDKERQVTSESSIKEVANLITNMCVNPETQRPYSLATIEKALHDAHFSLKNNRSTKQQALEMIPKLRESLKIDRAKMRIRVSVPGKNAKMLHSKLKAYFDTVEVEDWDKGDLEMVGLIEPGSYKAIVELVKGDKKEKLEQIGLELLSLKVIGENEVEVS
uniref:Ribosome maturation protein SBDS n=1 Tax=Globodera rostochiensis TaxID=31243 RepID=A0A914HB71_GLORO